MIHQWIISCVVKEVVVGRVTLTSYFHPITIMVSIPLLYSQNCLFSSFPYPLTNIISHSLRLHISSSSSVGDQVTCCCWCFDLIFNIFSSFYVIINYTYCFWLIGFNCIDIILSTKSGKLSSETYNTEVIGSIELWILINYGFFSYRT